MKTKGEWLKGLVLAITVLTLGGVTLAQQEGTHNLVSKEDAKNFERPSYSPKKGDKWGILRPMQRRGGGISPTSTGTKSRRA